MYKHITQNPYFNNHIIANGVQAAPVANVLAPVKNNGQAQQLRPVANGDGQDQQQQLLIVADQRLPPPLAQNDGQPEANQAAPPLAQQATQQGQQPAPLVPPPPPLVNLQQYPQTPVEPAQRNGA